MTYLLPIIAFASLIALSGCAEKETPSEAGIPAHFTTYADKQGLFSISYPSNWELFPPEAELEYHVNDIISSIESDNLLEEQYTVFIAGLSAIEYILRVQISFEPVPKEVRTNEEFVNFKIAEIKSSCQDYYEHSRIKTKINDREAVIIDYEANFDTDRLRVLITTGILTDKVTWGVACGSPVEEFSKWENDFHHIIRSFRILK